MALAITKSRSAFMLRFEEADASSLRTKSRFAASGYGTDFFEYDQHEIVQSRKMVKIQNEYKFICICTEISKE